MASQLPSDMVVRLTRELALDLGADLAFAYVWRGSRDEWLSRYKAVYPMCLGVTTHDLRLSLPDLAWYTVWGAPYVELFGRDRLASCPLFLSEPVAANSWECRLTQDMVTDASEVREAAKSHLGLEHFLDLSAPERQRRAPTFLWAPMAQNA